MLTRRAIGGLAVSVVALAGFTALPAAAEDYFEGKTITWVLPWPAGSGGDLHGRLTAKYMEKHIPGNPQIIVNNKPGGKGTIAINYVYEQAPKDGTSYFYGNWSPSAVLDKSPGVRYVPEEMGVVGSAGADLAFMIRYDQVPDLGSIEEADFIVGGRGATNAIEVLGNLALRTMGANFRYVGGFGGFSKIQAAIKADEVHGGHAGLPGYVKFFGPDSDVAYPLYYHQQFDVDGNPLPKPEKAYPASTPTFYEAYESVHGEAPSGKYWDAYKWWNSSLMSAATAILAPPGVDDGVLEIMQTAFQEVAKDPEYLKEYEDSIGVPPPFNPTEKTKQILQTFRDMPPEVEVVVKEVSAL
ncbi:hypothetical protein [Roseibium sp. MMSF_3544]|uniref:hypothetical protein n=1 Tax=unclassified Roseibium TaxID=2629323 RepID=UPI00273D5E7E|nr:hypothetical protein [Roseibium sp. MMSF_3544]